MMSGGETRETKCEFCGSRWHVLAECRLAGVGAYRAERQTPAAPSASPSVPTGEPTPKQRRMEGDARLERIAKVLAEFDEADSVSLAVYYRVSPQFIADVRAALTRHREEGP